MLTSTYAIEVSQSPSSLRTEVYLWDDNSGWVKASVNDLGIKVEVGTLLALLFELDATRSTIAKAVEARCRPT